MSKLITSREKNSPQRGGSIEIDSSFGRSLRMIPRSRQREIEKKKNKREGERERDWRRRREKNGAYVYEGASIIASRSPPFDRSLGKRRVHPPVLAPPRSEMYALVFPKIQSRGPFERHTRRYMCTLLLRPCGADRRMRFSRAPFAELSWP